MLIVLVGVFAILSMIVCIGIDIVGIIKGSSLRSCYVRLVCDVFIAGAWAYLVFLYIK